MILFAFISALGFGLANGIAQRYVHDLGVARTLFVRSVVSSIILAVLFVFWPHPVSFEGVLIAALVMVFGILAVYAFYRALGIGVSGIVTPIANSAVVVTVFVAALAFGESLGPVEYALIALIVVGIVALSHDGSRGRAHGLGFALLAMLCWGLAYAFLVVPTRLIGPIATPLVGEVLIVMLAGSVMWARHERLPSSSLAPLALIGVCIVAGVAGFTFALSSTPVSIVTAISASNPLVTAFYMRIVHGERLLFSQRLGSLAVIVGIVALSML